MTYIGILQKLEYLSILNKESIQKHKKGQLRDFVHKKHDKTWYNIVSAIADKNNLHIHFQPIRPLSIIH